MESIAPAFPRGVSSVNFRALLMWRQSVAQHRYQNSARATDADCNAFRGSPRHFASLAYQHWHDERTSRYFFGLAANTLVATAGDLAGSVCPVLKETLCSVIESQSP